jgi:hypothetical protein
VFTAEGQTVNCLRPLARLRRKISRPAAVLMRARKPCTRLRLIRLGLYVLFMVRLPEMKWGCNIGCCGGNFCELRLLSPAPFRVKFFSHDKTQKNLDARGGSIHAYFQTFLIRCNDLENVLGKVQTYVVCFPHGPSPYLALLNG